MKNIVILLISFLIVSCNADREIIQGERIDGPANIRDTINGNVLFSLNDNALVECTEAMNGWFVVGTEIKLSKAEESSFTIKKGTVLKDKNDNEIGKALNDFQVLMSEEDDGNYYGMVVGYTHQKNIKVSSIPENVLVELINKKGNQIYKNDLEDFMKSFRFERYDDEGNEYFIYENVIDDPSPRDRITLVFSDEKLKGIVHSRKLKLKGYTTYDLVRGHKFTPIDKLSKAEIKKVTKEKINFYNSVD